MTEPRVRPARFPTFHVAAILLAIACGACEPSPRSEGDPAPASCDDAAVRDVVTAFGERLQRVSTTAPDSLIVRAVRDEYASLVTAELLAEWTAAPAQAPGREVSSPWPDRIELGDVRPVDGACDVAGVVVYVTSVEAGTDSSAAREPVTVRVERAEGGWRIAAYDVEQEERPATSTDSAVAVVRRYFDALDARDHETAAAQWSDRARDEFAGALEAASDITVEIGEPGRIEGAAGSRYIAIPVEVRVVGSGGAARRFTGTYTLRRSVVDGATEEQRRWRIYTAELTER